jgi:hypothetical protein
VTLEEISRRWTEVGNRSGKVLALRDERPADSGGRRSLKRRATRGENMGGHL